MITPRKPVSADESAAILRLDHVERWPVGTIADQIGRYHDTIERVLVHGSLPVAKQTIRSRLVDLTASSELLANHRRSFDRDQRIEQEGHLRALVDEQRRAQQSRGLDRLFSAVPSSRVMMEQLANRGANLGAVTSGVLQLLDGVGADLRERAVAEVVARDQL